MRSEKANSYRKAIWCDAKKVATLQDGGGCRSIFWRKNLFFYKGQLPKNPPILSRCWEKTVLCLQEGGCDPSPLFQGGYGYQNVFVQNHCVVAMKTCCVKVLALFGLMVRKENVLVQKYCCDRHEQKLCKRVRFVLLLRGRLSCLCLRTENRSRKTHVFEYRDCGVGWGGHVNVPCTSYMKYCHAAEIPGIVDYVTCCYAADGVGWDGLRWGGVGWGGGAC